MTETTKKNKRIVPVGVIHVRVTTNNTFINVTDLQGNTISSSTGGHNNFKGSRKPTPYAAQKIAETALKKAKEFGLKTAHVEIKGIGYQREAALRDLQNHGVTITSVLDKTPIPHNGTRPRKTRRV